MAKENLEEKTQAPIIVFQEGIEMGGAGMGGIRVMKRNGNNDEEFINFGYKVVEAIYDAEGNPKWQNHDFDEHRQTKVPEHLKGMQIVFTDQVVYEGANMGEHHLSFLKNGKYIGYDSNKGTALDFGYGAIKAIFDRDGKSVWENWNYKPAEAKEA